MPKPISATTGRACTSISRFGRMASRLAGSNMPTCRKRPCITSAASSARQSSKCVHQRVHQQLQTPDPGFEAPYCSPIQRATGPSGRIPYATSPNGKRRVSSRTRRSIFRFCRDADGRDRCQNRSIPATRWTRTFTTCRRRSCRTFRRSATVREAIEALEADHDSTRGDVFPEDLIEGYMELKWEEITISSTHRIRSNSRCITASRTHPTAVKGLPSGSPFLLHSGFPASAAAVTLGLNRVFIPHPIITF